MPPTLICSISNVNIECAAHERTKTLLSLLSALLSAAVLFLARRSGAKSRGNLEAVFGLRLPERLVAWFSLSAASPLRRDPRVGSGLEAAAAAAAAPVDSLLVDCDFSDGSGVGRGLAGGGAETVAPLIAGS